MTVALTKARQIGRKRVRIPAGLKSDLREGIDEGHGLVGTPEHNSWRGMKMRCNNKNHAYYDIYGGRGITVDKTWAEFPSFLKDMGPRPKGHTLDRKNVNKGYSKGNCVWADIVTQNRNRRNVVNTFEEMLDEANGSIEFSSSAAAEKFIHSYPELRRAAAFSWWLGSGSRWGIAINRGGTSFTFIRQVGDQFVAGGNLLESNSSFMSEYTQKTFPSPFFPRDRIWTFNAGKTLVQTEMREFDGHIHFSSIISPTDSGKGYAGKVIRKITELADKHDVTISLGAKPFGDVPNKLNKSQLTRWYKKHGWGFEDGKRSDMMIRKPSA